VLGCVTQCSQSSAHSYEQFLQVQQIGFVTLGPLRHVWDPESQQSILLNYFPYSSKLY